METPRPYPQSYEELEKLVQTFSNPSSSENVSWIGDVLQQVQRSPQGWQLADALLQSHDANVRFFGASTFVVKINTDWQSLDTTAFQSLLEKLLSLVARLSAAKESNLVLRKMVVALVTYFARSKEPWEDCIRHVAFALAGHDVSRQDLEGFSIKTVLPTLGDDAIRILLWFAASLFDEIGKTSADGLETYQIHQRLISNANDIVSVIRHGLSATGSAEIVLESLKCFQSIIDYLKRAWKQSGDYIDTLRSLVQPTTAYLADEVFMDEACAVLTEISTEVPQFLNDEHYHSIASFLCSHYAEKYILSWQAPEDNSDGMAIAGLLLAFADAKLSHLAMNSQDRMTQQILNSLLQLLSCYGYPIPDEDEICAKALDFWNTFAEFVSDAETVVEGKQLAWRNSAIWYLKESTRRMWLKIKLPPPEVAEDWDAEDRTCIKTLRRDFGDMLASVYLLIGLDALLELIEQATLAAEKHAWTDLEATLFCIKSLGEVVSDREEADQSLSTLVNSSTFVTLTDENIEAPISVQQIVIELIREFTSFFERQTQFLPLVLTFLFRAARNTKLGPLAARTISDLSQSCRKSLATDFASFVEQYSKLTDLGVKDRVLEALAALVQGMPSEEAQIHGLSMLITYIENEASQTMSFIQRGETEEALAYGLHTLRCLTNIAKGIQSPDDSIINVEEDQSTSTVWQQHAGQEIQARIIKVMGQLYESMKGEGEMVEATCQILRAGYTETTPGPFVFPPKLTEQMLTSCPPSSNRLVYALETAGILFAAKPSLLVPDIDVAAAGSLHHLLFLVDTLDRNPSNEPEVASSCITLASKMLNYHLSAYGTLSNSGQISTFFEFTLSCLLSNEIFPKRAASQFWATFLQLTDRPPELQEMITQVIEAFGPRLAEALVLNFGGAAVRSDLDDLAEPLKKMVARQPKAKVWLANALEGQMLSNVNEERVGAKERREWLLKIVNLRGRNGTNTVVKDFWRACTGTTWDTTLR